MSSVPNFPGVPPLSSYGQFASGLIFSDAISALTNVLFGNWGVYLNGTPVLVPGGIPGLSTISLALGIPGISPGVVDSIISWDYRQDWPTIDYPIEQGQFTTYNKITRPYLGRLRVSKGGSTFDRQTLLSIVDGMANSFDLFTVVTPEKTYTDLTVNHVDYRRNGETVGLLVMDIWFQQVQEDAAVAFSASSVLAPAAASPVSTGNTQPQSPSSIEISALPSVM